jgi:preprotein translocase subunit YajC
VIIVVYLVILAAAFFFLIVLPQRRRMAAHQRLMASLEVGDQIVTSGGFHGTVRGLDDVTVMVEIASGVVVEVARGAIAAKVLPSVPELPEQDLPRQDGPDEGQGAP